MKLYVIGIGPGELPQMTPRAAQAIAASQVVAGYTLYLELIEPLLAGKERISTAMKGEVKRCKAAVDAALSGRTVAVISSGDAGVYGMAGLVLELAAPYPQLEVEVIPGITAACASAAVLGAPLGHDFAVISLSDLLTDLALIEKRIRLASQADFLLCLYNPASKKRADYLGRACAIVLENRPGETPCGIVRNAGRQSQRHKIMTLSELAHTPVDMFTTVIIGNSQTKIIGGRLVTPRGYLGLVVN